MRRWVRWRQYSGRREIARDWGEMAKGISNFGRAKTKRIEVTMVLVVVAVVLISYY